MPLHVRLLGTLELLQGGAPFTLPQSRKTRALLAYLVATSRPHSRAALCELLWEGPDDPRAALRWSLTKLRSLLDADGVARLIANRDSVSFNRRQADVDLFTVREDVGADVRAAPTEVLIRSAQRFRGEFLDDLDLPDCYRYHEWWTAERESIRAMRVAILSTLTDRLQDDSDAALGYARARLLIDPLSEAAHIRVIELLGAAGRAREALQQYESCRRMLQGQLGARPSPALERARAALGSTRSVEAEPLPRVAAPASPPSLLVGRASEREQIAAAVAAAVAGRSRDVIWITGEPGIGKTRLLEETACCVRAANGTVLPGRAYEAEMVRPYGPWIDALRSVSLTVTEQAGDRQRLFDGVVAALVQLTSGGRPVGLILDDVQWIDEASAGLLNFVARETAGSHLLLVCGARSAEAEDNAAMRGVVRALRRDARLRHLPLERLDAAEVRQIVGSIDARIDADRVFEESEGNPLFAIEIAHALRRGGDSASLPDVEGLILDRVARLEERARHLVPWAAALGHNFSPEILRLASGLAPAELVGAVEELERRGILCSSPPAPATYDFTHDLIRRAVYGQLSDPRRRVVHLQLARTLSTMPDPDAALAGDVAHHASLGGDAELAARAAVAAGDRSLRMFAWTEAYALAEHGMRHAAQLPRDTRIRLHMALLKVAVHASIGAPGARSLDEDVSRLTIEAQDAGLAAEVATGYYLLSFRHHVDGNFAAAHDDTLRAAEAGRQEDSAVAARTLANSGRCLALIERDMPKARAMLTEAQQLAGSSCLAIVDISWGLGLVRAFDGAYDDAVRLLESAVMLARREQDHWAECQALQRLALIEFERRDPAAARDRARQFAAVALKMGEGSEAPFAAVLEALANVSIDDPDADKAVADALTALRAVDAKALLSHALSLAAAMDLERGDVDRARLRAEEALAAAEVVGRRSEIVMALIVLARAARQKGDAAAVSRYARAASTNLQDPSSVASHVRQAARILSGR